MNYFNNHRRKLIKQNYIRGTKATAQGVQKLELENTVNLPPCKLEIHGNTEQKMYDGSNVFNLQNALNTDNWFYSGGSWSYSLNLEAGKEYTLSLDTLIMLEKVAFDLCRKNKVSSWAYETVKRFHTSVGKRYVSFIADGRECLWIYRDNVANPANRALITELLTSCLKVMLVEGAYTADTLPPYEPYVGRSYSPSLEYPQPIESVHDFMLCYDLENDEHYTGALSCMVNDVHLLGIENAIDTLCVDYGRKKAFKNERVLYKSVGELIDAYGAEYDGIGAICINNDQPRMEIYERNIPYYCTHFISYHNDPHVDESNPRFEVTASGQILFYYPPLRSVEEFKAWCYENDVKIAYVLENEHQIDITNTEAGQALLNLTLPEGESVIFEVNSKLPPKSMILEYYSKTKEDKHKITVNYEDISRIQIKDSDEHFVRRDSLCKIISPNIDGYEPESESITVYAGNDMEITLIYNKK